MGTRNKFGGYLSKLDKSKLRMLLDCHWSFILRDAPFSCTSLIRLNPEQATTEGVTAGRTDRGEAGTRPAEKQSP